MEITWKEVKEWLDTNKDSGDLKKYLGDFSKSYLASDEYKTFLASDEGKKLYQPEIDRAVSKGIDSWKEKTMPGIIEEKVSEKYKKDHPDETEEQRRIRELEEKQEKQDAELKKEKLTKVAITTLTNAKLEALVDLAEQLIGEDEETTLARCHKFEELINKKIEAEVKNAIPGRNVNESEDGFEDPSFKNPFLKDHWNLTEQGKLFREKPDLAKKLQKAASNKK